MEHVHADNLMLEQACSEAERKLKKVDKVVAARVAVLNEIKANFAYIYEQIRLIKRLEQLQQNDAASMPAEQAADEAGRDWREWDIILFKCHSMILFETL